MQKMKVSNLNLNDGFLRKDLSFVESLGRELSLKVKTRLMDGVSKKCKVAIDDRLFDVIYIDYSKKENLMYFYLEEVRRIAE